MPKNPVTDPITDQEIAFAHLVLSGTMHDHRAAEAVGLNPDTAAYTKSKPRVRAYMIEHRAAVRDKLVDREAEGLRQPHIGRDQILARLWELATLNPEATKGSIAGQIKALSMIVAIEGLIPGRRFSPTQTQTVAPPSQPQIYPSAWRRQQQQPEGAEPVHAPTAVEAQPAAPPNPEPVPSTIPATAAPSSHLDRSPTSHASPIIHPATQSYVPDATGYTFDAVLNTPRSLSLRMPLGKSPIARGR